MTRYVTNMTIDDAEHFTAEQRAEVIAGYPEHERLARVKGYPAMGSGRVYPVADASISVDPFLIPTHWAQLAALDFGWDHPTAAIKLAHDRDADIVYVIAAYRRREATPIEHCAALKGWGDVWWAWPHDGLQRDKGSGVQLRHDYEAHGLNMLAKQAQFEDGGNGVEAGVILILERMQSGRLKVFSHLTDWFDEFRLYHRKDDRVLRAEEWRSLWEWGQGAPYPWGPLLCFLMISAQRLGEVAGMRWDEIDGDVWAIPAARHKSFRRHEVPLSKALVHLLSTLPRHDAHVFSTRPDRPVVPGSTLKNRIVAATGITDWRFHDLRRTGATFMAEGGVQRFIIERVLGHADHTVTAIYDRATYRDEKRQALEMLAETTGAGDGRR